MGQIGNLMRMQPTPLSVMLLSATGRSPKVYTVYSWTVKERHENDFVSAWRDLASWMIRQKGSTGSIRLFRDMSAMEHFMSVDSWENEESLKALREEPEFNRKLAHLRRLLDNFSSWPLTLEAEEKI